MAVRFECDKCGNLFIETPHNSKTEISWGEVILIGYCPVCGNEVRINSTSSSGGSVGGKF